MNIGIISYGYFPETLGGAEQQSQKLARILSSKNHKITLFAGSKFNETRDENANLKIKRIEYKNIKFLRIFLAQLLVFIPEIKREVSRLSLLLCYQVAPSGIIGLFSKMLFKLPLIIWMRAETEYKSLLGKFIFTPILLKFSDIFIVQTNKMKKDLISLYSKKILFKKNKLEKIRIIPNGVDIDNCPLIPHKHRSGLVYIGRLHKVKGIKYLLEAMKGVKEKLYIIGEGPDKSRLLKMAKSLNVEFLGKLPQREVFNCLKKTKLLVLPSLSEAMPNVILEAISFGVPIVATKVGGIVDIIKHGQTGFLVEPKNSKQLRKYLEILLEDEELWNKISMNCLIEAEKYSWTRVIDNFEKVLVEI